jgi:inhibitor of cysteine peptidase
VIHDPIPRRPKVVRIDRCLALGALLFLGACASKPHAITKSQKDDGSTVEMHVGDQLDVTLDSNPTTGLSWVIAAGDSIVALQGEPQFLPGSDAQGAPGTETLHFGAADKGKTTLRLEYKKPFEQDVPPAKVYTLRVAVD